MTNAPALNSHDDLDDETSPSWLMPATVRGARLIALVSSAVGVVLIVIGAALGKQSPLGVVVGYLPTFALIPLVVLFGRAGDRVRVAAVTLAVIGALTSCTGILTGLPPGAVGIVASGAVAALLLRPSAKAWFVRER
ncbi:hypothetical protein [Nocardia caishijiensis]|uniref:Uncharacterized protein n=1 Tax=Nocardia caishijiensis TaxID=184756 RepID=A0ABQ6YNM8_9NOCA|nr:hypothetical protein [Nocardia caishijiensis]KAF0847409.1 hypothetical protein FNL39_103307 [Nocardia caishijiensis]